jgi:D-xylose 1-dehydrogenase (NADP+, D-xylono-1,5-lactone-forming)
MYRYTDRTRRVLGVVRSGALGEIKQVTASFRFLLANPASIKLRPELGGGALYDVGCYTLNFIGLVLDEAARQAAGAAGDGAVVTPPPVSVAVECVREGGIDVNFSALLKYPAGLLAAMHCGFNAHKRIGAEIIGTLGVLEIPETFFDNAGAITLIHGEERTEIPVVASDRYKSEVEDFADAILHGRAPRLGLAESVRNMEVLDLLRAASG